MNLLYNLLVQVEKDPVRAVEYCGRAILANPGDPELLSLYGKLIWETEGDDVRAKSYFHHALLASPHDWYYFFNNILLRLLSQFGS